MISLELHWLDLRPSSLSSSSLPTLPPPPPPPSSSSSLPSVNAAQLLEYQLSDGIDTLKFQAISLNLSLIEGNSNENYHLRLLDPQGREILENDDLTFLLPREDSTTSPLKLPIYCLITESEESFCFPFCTSLIPCHQNTSVPAPPADDSNSSGQAQLQQTPEKNYEILQWKREFLDGSCALCINCQRLLDESLLLPLQNVIASLGMIPLTAFQCQSKKLFEIGLLPIELQGSLQPSQSFLNDALQCDSPYQLYFKRALLQQTLQQQRQLLTLSSPAFQSSLQQQRDHFLQRLGNGIHVILTYEDPQQQAKALHFLNYAKILEYYEEELEKSLDYYRLGKTDEEIFFIALLKWFKIDFFKWCNKPFCDYCEEGRPPYMDAIGMDQPNHQEKTLGWATKVESYRCQKCLKTTRFPRYNNPSYMMEYSRRGRCGEFANVFGLICRSLGFDVNYVLDFTDHVWIEVWNPTLRSYIHVDSCERAYNSPLMYEVGWQKKLTHVLSFNRSFIHDSISRYSHSLETVLIRRNQEVLLECEVGGIITMKNKELENRFLRTQLSHTNLSFTPAFSVLPIIDRLRMGIKGFENINISHAISLDERQYRLQKDMIDLEQMKLYSNKNAKLEEMQGRISGDLAWRQARGEIHDKSAENQKAAATCDISLQTCATNLTPSTSSSTKITIYQEYKEKWATFANSQVMKNEFGWLFTNGNLINGLFIGSRCYEFKFSFLKFYPNLIPNDRILNSYPKSLLAKKLFNLMIVNKFVKIPLKLLSVNFLFFSEEGFLFNYFQSHESNPEINILKIFSETVEGEDEELNRFRRVLQLSRGLLLIYNHHSQLTLQDQPNFLSFLNHLSFENKSFENCLSDNECFIFLTVDKGLISNLPTKFLAPSAFNIEARKNSSNLTLIGANYSISCILPKIPVPTSTFHYHEVPGFISSNTKFISFPLRKNPNVSDHAVIEEAKLKCQQSPDLIGFSLFFNMNKKIEQVWYFDQYGLPLRPSPQHSCTFFRIHNGDQNLIQNNTPLSNYSMDCLVQYHIGGGNHPDTISFDMLETCFSNSYQSNEYELSRISLFAGIETSTWLSLLSISPILGDSLVNGLQTYYKSKIAAPVKEIKSNRYSSNEGSPQERIVVINPGERITHVNCHCGALIDRVEIITTEKAISVGGHGGERFEVPIPESKELIGFTGGTGGHLHNIGLVLREKSLCTAGFEADIKGEGLIPLREQILNAINAAALFDNSCCFHSIPLFGDSSVIPHDPLRHHQLYELLDRATQLIQLSELLSGNSKRENLKKAIQMILFYFQNISKNPTELKYQKINFFNESFLTKVLLSLDGNHCDLLLFFLSFGPAAFSLSYQAPVTSSAAAPQSPGLTWILNSRFASIYQENEQLKQFFSKSFYLQSLEKYCKFLEFLIQKL